MLETRYEATGCDGRCRDSVGNCFGTEIDRHKENPKILNLVAGRRSQIHMARVVSRLQRLQGGMRFYGVGLTTTAVQSVIWVEFTLSSRTRPHTCALYTTAGVYGDHEGPRSWIPILDSAATRHRASHDVTIKVTAPMKDGLSVVGFGEDSERLRRFCMIN
jgi:hypothetical protein